MKIKNKNWISNIHLYNDTKFTTMIMLIVTGT